jgi:hypothetical protein
VQMGKGGLVVPSPGGLHIGQLLHQVLGAVRLVSGVSVISAVTAIDGGAVAGIQWTVHRFVADGLLFLDDEVFAGEFFLPLFFVNQPQLGQLYLLMQFWDVYLWSIVKVTRFKLLTDVVRTGLKFPHTPLGVWNRGRDVLHRLYWPINICMQFNRPSL